MSSLSCPHPDPELSILVVSYNTRDLTLACLESVYEETLTPFELIVVDNASTDGSAEAIALEFPKATLIARPDNLGFARANNLAAQSARGKQLLLLNPDTVVLNNAIDRLCAFARAQPEARIWGGRTLFGDQSLNPSSCWRRITLWNLFCRWTGLTGLAHNSPLFNSESYGGWPRDAIREVDIVTGCLLLIARADWDRLDGFDPAFIMYGEDADLCLRARADLDARPAVTPEATIIHYGGASETVRSDKLVRLLRAKAELIERHISIPQRALARMMLAAWPLSRAVVFGLFNRSTPWREAWRRRAEWRRGFSE